MGLLCCLDQTGDTKVIWDPRNTDEVACAKATFDKLTKKGHAAFSVNADGSQGTQIRAFDPTAEKIILVPQMVGG